MQDTANQTTTVLRPAAFATRPLSKRKTASRLSVAQKKALGIFKKAESQGPNCIGYPAQSAPSDDFSRIEKGYIQVIAFLQDAKNAERDQRLTLDHFIGLRLATSRYADLLTNLVERYIGIRFENQPGGFEEETCEPILSETKNAIEGAGYNLSVCRYGVKKGTLKNTELVILLKVVNRLLDYIDRDICRFTRKPSQIQTVRVRSDEINAWLLEALKAPITNGTFSLMEAHHGN